jgi:predicted ATPase
LSHADAVRLFIERAVQVQPGFTVTNRNAPAVAQICHDLDGIPLAIELAAARVRLLSVEQIAAGLADRFQLLTGGARTALARQQTLLASVEWSHELLGEPKRMQLRRLGVFLGGFTLDGCQSVCSGEGFDRPPVLDVFQVRPVLARRVGDEPPDRSHELMSVEGVTATTPCSAQPLQRRLPQTDPH